MAKRFTDTDKYKKPFLRSLTGAYKLLWDYICNDCNHAGVWIVDFEIAKIYLGKDIEIDRETALNAFNADKKRVIEIDNSRWFVLSFIKFQYGILNPQNRAHLSVISYLKSFNLWNDEENTIKPLISPLQGAKDKVKDKDKDKKGGCRGKKTPSKPQDSTLDFSIVPKEFLLVVKKWTTYKDERSERYKPAGFAAMVRKLIREAENDPITADEIIEDAMAKNYQGFFKLNKSSNNGRNNGAPAKTAIPTNTGGYKDSL